MMKDFDFSKQWLAPFAMYFSELRRRLIIYTMFLLASTGITFYFAADLFNFLLIPLERAHMWQAISGQKLELIYTAPLEYFVVKLKVALFFGFILSMPVLIWHLYYFIAPGLYKKERHFLLFALIAVPCLFLLGAFMVYLLFFPTVLLFSLTMQQMGSDAQTIIRFLGRVSEYLSLFMTMMMAFGLVFQLPVVTSLLVYFKILSAQSLKDQRKYAILIIFILAALLTPPDVLSQISLAVPTLVLYEIAIKIAQYLERYIKIYPKQNDKE